MPMIDEMSLSSIFYLC